MSSTSAKRSEGGRRKDWAAAARSRDQPLITVITSTFNAVEDLPWTAKSLQSQDYPYIQWIIVDGGSTDGTVDWLVEHSDLVDIWFSESDAGIYDAWNKALRYAQGEWVQFLGAGDELASKETLKQVSQVLFHAYPQYTLVYGIVEFVSERRRIALSRAGEPWEELKSRGLEVFLPVMPEHPAVFAHRSLFKFPAPFDNSYAVAADTRFMIEATREREPLYADILVDRMPLGGVTGAFGSFEVIYKEHKRLAAELGIKPGPVHSVKESSKYALKKLLLKSLGAEGAVRLVDSYRLMVGKRKRWTVA